MNTDNFPQGPWVYRHELLAALRERDEAQTEVARLKMELTNALLELRAWMPYNFEKYYGELAVELGIEHDFKYFPPTEEAEA